MRLGNKIKKYRNLRGLTQKQLGEMVGFKPSTALVRINQYETGKMAPKEEIRSNIAHALDIDIEALSDVETETFEDYMYVFFELEEQYGMSVEERNGKVVLSFDSNNESIDPLLNYLDFWYKRRRKVDGVTDGKIIQDKEYLRWKSKIKTNLEEYYDSIKNRIEDVYSGKIAQGTWDRQCVEKTSDVVRTIRRIIESGTQVARSPKNGLSFIVDELINPSSEEAALALTELFWELQGLKNLSQRLSKEINLSVCRKHGELIANIEFPAVDVFGLILQQSEVVIESIKNGALDNATTRYTFDKKLDWDLEHYYWIFESGLKIAGFMD